MQIGIFGIQSRFSCVKYTIHNIKYNLSKKEENIICEYVLG